MLHLHWKLSCLFLFKLNGSVNTILSIFLWKLLISPKHLWVLRIKKPQSFEIFSGRKMLPLFSVPSSCSMNWSISRCWVGQKFWKKKFVFFSTFLSTINFTDIQAYSFFQVIIPIVFNFTLLCTWGMKWIFFSFKMTNIDLELEIFYKTSK